MMTTNRRFREDSVATLLDMHEKVDRIQKISYSHLHLRNNLSQLIVL